MNENNEHMNPNFPNQRGCFVDKRTPNKILLVDYPTWCSKNGRENFGEANAPIASDKPFEKEFATVHEAYVFAESEHYAVCEDPWTKHKFEKKPVAQDDDDIDE